MNPRTQRRNENNAGMALLTALMFISIMIIVLTSMMARYIQQRLTVDRFEDYYACFEAAEAAIQQGVSALNNGNYNFRIGIPDDWEPEWNDDNELVLPAFEEVAEPGTIASMPGAEFIVYLHQWENDGRDTNGDGVTDSEAEIGVFSVHAAARANGITRQLETVFTTRDFGIWNNAIFAGAGQAGGLINGNVSIHGSVHLLGDGLPAGARALSIGGTARLKNSYEPNVGPAGSNFTNNIRPRIPPIATTTVNGETVETLRAEVRIRKGMGHLNSGSNRVGLAQVNGSGVKGPVDGTFVNDGWSGSTEHVNSDNGITEPYDLGNQISLPMFNDHWRDPDSGERVHNPLTGTWYTHAEYFKDVLVGGESRTVAGGTYNGNVTISNSKNQGFYYNATTGETATGVATNAISPNPNHHYILKKANSTIMQINGAIHINGNLSFSGSVNYYGRAALLVEGTVTVPDSLLSVKSPTNANDFTNSFPHISCLGIMSTGLISLGTGSQASIMGAFYSQDRINVSKQTPIGGTIVSKYFDMGGQVPAVYQVPVLAQNLPLGMIGDFPVLNVSQLMWREIGI